MLERLAASDMNQSELARRIRVSKDAVSTYARGRSIPNPQTLARMASVFGCEPADLLPARYDTAGMASPLKMHMLQDGRVAIEVMATVSLETAMDIMKLLTDDAADAA
jgi:transcriptional regulator with XRE-family HTH domain